MKAVFKPIISVLAVIKPAVVASLLVLVCTLFSHTAKADTFDFGGRPERYKGDGDQEPPRCVVSVPRAATEPFFIKWNCEDDDTPADIISSEVWAYRVNGTRGELVGSFLGFPASLFVDTGTVQNPVFTDGLPIQFRFVVRDRAGIATVSPFLTVQKQDNSVEQCDISIVAAATESTDTITGHPALAVLANNVSVTSSQLQQNSVTVTSFGKVSTSTCQIDSICSDGDSISFSAGVNFTNGSASGTITVTPGTLSAQASGTGTVETAVLSEFEMSGTAVIPEGTATVTLQCEK